jgi:hypothetical protein
MKLEEYKKDSYEFSKLTSDLVRQFAFAGIAIIWIFKFDKIEHHLIPPELIIPLLFFVATLAFDLFQFLIPTIIWTIFFRYNEKKNKGVPDVNIKASGWLSFPGWFFFSLKIITLTIGYFKIVLFLISKI